MQPLSANQRFKIWLNSPSISANDKDQLQKLDSKTINNRFNQSIQMNNSGWRRPIGLGSDLFNLYTIKQIAFAWFSLLKKTIPKARILVFTDQRNMSTEAKMTCITVAASLNLPVYTFSDRDRFTPTPFLTYLLKHHNFDGGIMITASHCPVNYNGCKLFDKNGVGITGKTLNEFNQLLSSNYKTFLNTPIKPQSAKLLLNSYKTKYAQVQNNFFQPFAIQPKIIALFFTALHGTATNWTDHFLKQRGFSVFSSSFQNDFDQNFSTLKDLNPENDQIFNVLKNEIKSLPKSNGSLIIANDCDGDRVRIGVYQAKKWLLLHGNEVATCLVYFLFNELKRKGIVYRTWVSSPLIDRICQFYSQPILTTETGPINLATSYLKNPQQFLFAFEESLGYLPSLKTNVYKDGIFTAQFLAEAANYLMHQQKITLWDYLQQIYNRFGYYTYDQVRFNYRTKPHLNLMTVKTFFQNQTTINQFQIIKQHYLPTTTNLRLIIFELKNQNRIALRFSATEPVFKIYFTSVAKSMRVSQLQLIEIKHAFLQNLDKIK